MRRRVVEPQSLPANLAEFRLHDWYDPKQDPPVPAEWLQTAPDRPSAPFECHAVRAIRRYLAARDAALGIERPPWPTTGPFGGHSNDWRA